MGHILSLKKSCVHCGKYGEQIDDGVVKVPVRSGFVEKKTDRWKCSSCGKITWLFKGMWKSHSERKK